MNFYWHSVSPKFSLRNPGANSLRALWGHSPAIQEEASRPRRQGRDCRWGWAILAVCIVAIQAGLCQAADKTGEKEPKKYVFDRIRMGVPWQLQIYADDPKLALEASELAFDRVKELDRILSDYDPDSELNQLCSNAQPGQPTTVSEDLFRVLTLSQQLSRRTNGAFDVTVGPITDLWRRAWRKRAMPAADDLQAALEQTGYNKVQLNREMWSVTLARSDMQIDLGAVAKGYAAQEALQVLAKQGLSRVLIDASGDITVGDPPPGRDHWLIRIERLPDQEEGEGEWLQLKNASVATSGDAKRFIEIDGVRYSHIVDPKTGLGLTNTSSVTVIAADGMIADALASALSVLPPDAGLMLLKRYDAHAFLMLGTEQGIQTRESCGYGRFRADRPPPE